MGLHGICKVLNSLSFYTVSRIARVQKWNGLYGLGFGLQVFWLRVWGVGCIRVDSRFCPGESFCGFIRSFWLRRQREVPRVSQSVN